MSNMKIFSTKSAVSKILTYFLSSLVNVKILMLRRNMEKQSYIELARLEILKMLKYY